MIVFTPFKEIPQEFLEYRNIGQVALFNLSSYFNDGFRLNALMPSVEYIPENILAGDCSSPEFDTAYWNYIFNNAEPFCQLMDIVRPVYDAANTFIQILVNNTSQFSNEITESLCKLIQQRYGYNAAIANEFEDLWYIEESTFSIPGLFAFDQDIQRWISMMPIDENYE